MKAAVEKDRTERTISINVVDGPVLDVTRPDYHRRPRHIRVERVTIRVVDGVIRELTALGGLVLKNGTTSLGQRDRRTWGPETLQKPVDSLPEWARLLWDEAPNGATYWAEEG